MTPTRALGMSTVMLASRDGEVGPQRVASSKSAHPRVVSVITGSTIEVRVAPCLGSSGALAPVDEQIDYIQALGGQDPGERGGP